MYISTHTPVRVWHSGRRSLSLYLYFNSHTREGVTCYASLGCALPVNFNSHTREGVTPSQVLQYMYFSNFNSHTREGVTHCNFIIRIPFQFQLTHPWGCDVLAAQKQELLSDFNSHTREGVTCGQCHCQHIQGFQLIWYQRILLRIIATFKHIKYYLVCRKCVYGKICFLKNTPLWNSCWKTHHQRCVEVSRTIIIGIRHTCQITLPNLETDSSTGSGISAYLYF